MSWYHIVAVNGQMGLPAGWSLPIIQDGEQCRVIGDDIASSFPANRLDGLQQQGMIRLLQSTVDFDPEIAKQETAVDDIEFHEDLFSELLYVLYFDRSLFDGVGIDINSLLTVQGKLACPRNASDSVVAYVVTKRSLIHALHEICNRFHDRIMERLTEHDWASVAELTDDALRLLSRSYYDLAYNRDVARRAIVRRALLIQASPNVDVLEDWLSAASRRWGFKHPLDYWSKRMRSVRSVVECCMNSAYGGPPNHDKIMKALSGYLETGELSKNIFLRDRTSSESGSRASIRSEKAAGGTAMEAILRGELISSCYEQDNRSILKS